MNKKIIISGGGTGGHVFPAIAIANALKKLDPSIDLLFVGAEGKIEMTKVPAAGYPIEGLWISGFQRKLTAQNLSFPFKLLSSMWRSRKIINRFKPDAVVGVGGYASGPLVKVATMKGIPALIQEQNSFPGITNRLLGSAAQKICVVYDTMDRFFPKEKLIITGSPVRQAIIDLKGTKEEAIKHFGLNPNKKVLFITGGSLGARGINEGIAFHLEALKKLDIQLIWQAGKAYIDWAKKQVEGETDWILATDFVDRMDLAYIAADAILARAGGTISELAIVGKPAILMPSPNVTEDHQTANAQSMVDKGAALMVKDKEAKEKLYEAIHTVLFDKDKGSILSKNIKEMAITNAAERIAAEVIKMI